MPQQWLAHTTAPGVASRAPSARHGSTLRHHCTGRGHPLRCHAGVAASSGWYPTCWGPFSGGRVASGRSSQTSHVPRARPRRRSILLRARISNVACATPTPGRTVLLPDPTGAACVRRWWKMLNGSATGDWPHGTCCARASTESGASRGRSSGTRTCRLERKVPGKKCRSCAKHGAAKRTPFQTGKKKLVVLGKTVGGRFSREAVVFRRLLAKARAGDSPVRLCPAMQRASLQQLAALDVHAGCDWLTCCLSCCWPGRRNATARGHLWVTCWRVLVTLSQCPRADSTPPGGVLSIVRGGSADNLNTPIAIVGAKRSAEKQKNVLRVSVSPMQHALTQCCSPIPADCDHRACRGDR